MALILAVKVDQIERAQLCSGVVIMPANEIEYREALVIDGDGLAVDQAGAHDKLLIAQRSAGSNREIVIVAGQQPDALAIPNRQDAKAIVLDLVNPARTARRLFGGAGQIRLKSG